MSASSPKSLSEILLAGEHREQLVAAVTRQIEKHASRISGLRGMALRTALTAAQAARADVIPKAVSRVLPEVIAALEPLYQRSRAEGADFSVFLKHHAGEAADTIMGVVDARAARTGNAALRKLYARLRGAITDEVRSTLPVFAQALAARARTRG